MLTALDWTPWLEKRVIYEHSSGCWTWMGAKDAAGYGRAGTGETAHRHVWRLYRGPIPTGAVLHHVCRQRDCVNPDHLEVKERGEHMREHRADNPQLSTEEKRTKYNLYHQIWNRQRRLLTLCRQCNSRAVPGLIHCQAHRDRTNQTKQALRQRQS